MSECALDVQNVIKEYPGAVRTRVLHGVSFSLAASEFAALIGPSGSGKSTLLNLLGLLDRPSSGKIFIEGQDTSRLDEQAMTRFRGVTIGFVFQFHHLLPAFTALENVLLPEWSASGKRPNAEARARAIETLDAMGLLPHAHKKPTQLSGGQQQRVAIARALAHRPKLVLADEPTGNLDTQSADDVFALMRDFNEAFGTTFLVVTHDPRLAARTDRTVHLVDGRIVDVDERKGAVSRSGDARIVK